MKKVLTNDILLLMTHEGNVIGGYFCAKKNTPLEKTEYARLKKARFDRMNVFMRLGKHLICQMEERCRKTCLLRKKAFSRLEKNE